MKKKLNTEDLVRKIERLAKSRIASQDVVQLDQFRGVAQKDETPTVLVIEDDETMQSAIKRVLEPEGYLMKIAGAATDLGEVLDDSSVDLIILDIGLPWVNGFELAQMLKEHPDLRRIPILFLSAQASPEDMKRAFAVGAHDFLKKPFDVEKLKKTVKALVALTPR